MLIKFCAWMSMAALWCIAWQLVCIRTLMEERTDGE